MLFILNCFVLFGVSAVLNDWQSASSLLADEMDWVFLGLDLETNFRQTHKESSYIASISCVFCTV